MELLWEKLAEKNHLPNPFMFMQKILFLDSPSVLRVSFKTETSSLLSHVFSDKE